MTKAKLIRIIQEEIAKVLYENEIPKRPTSPTAAQYTKSGTRIVPRSDVPARKTRPVNMNSVPTKTREVPIPKEELRKMKAKTRKIDMTKLQSQLNPQAPAKNWKSLGLKVARVLGPAALTYGIYDAFKDSDSAETTAKKLGTLTLMSIPVLGQILLGFEAKASSTDYLDDPSGAMTMAKQGKADTFGAISPLRGGKF